MTDLHNVLENHVAPAPAPDLSARILAAAATQSPANDMPVQSRRPLWAGLTSVAALALAGVLFLSPGTDVDAQWETVAQDAGFGELYDWAHEEG